MASYILENEDISVEVLYDWGYERSRYDWGGTVSQVTKAGHTFLSREVNANGSTGLSGVGLTNVLEWENTDLYDKTEIAGHFPMLGIGLCRKTDTAPFLFTRDYPVTPFQRIVEADADHVSIRTLPHMVLDTAVDMTKTYTLSGNSLIVSFKFHNVGRTEIHATEFCHNFIKFDDRPVDSSYRVSFPYSLTAEMRRGQIILERDAYRIGEFDIPTESSAFWIHGWEGMQSHWMKIENIETSASVFIEDNFPVCKFYSWNNINACCPEIFAPIHLRPNESLSYTRKYTFNT